MESLKELAVDALIVLLGIVIITAQGAVNHAKGLSCGRIETSAQAKP